MSEETKKKISLARTGKPVSAFQLQRMKETRVDGMKGKKHSSETKLKMRLAALGRIISPEHIKKISGANNWNWKGGISPENKKIRMSVEFKNWRMSVFRRDEYKCIQCGYSSKGTRPSDIHADHIKPFAKYPELRFSMENGRTLCVPCHKKTDTWGGRTH